MAGGRARTQRVARAALGARVGLSAEEVTAFRERVLGHYREHGRHDLPWRLTHDPYAVLVSEVMLQQTQVARVVPYFERWMEAFPTPDALAAAPLDAVLEHWQGLGYNRRAVALRRAAETIARDHGGEVPRDYDALLALPGVGPATASAVLAFAYGEARPLHRDEHPQRLPARVLRRRCRGARQRHPPARRGHT
jgi:A/G-specific adenine glycosylase